jgi:hypothetical protein
MSFHRAILIPSALSLSAIAFASVPAFARPSSRPSQTKHWELSDDVIVNGTNLPAGRYNIVVDNGKAMFTRKGRILATANCDWKALDSKSDFDGIVTDDQNVLQEIDFDGSAQALELK